MVDWWFGSNQVPLRSPIPFIFGDPKSEGPKPPNAPNHQFASKLIHIIARIYWDHILLHPVCITWPFDHPLITCRHYPAPPKQAAKKSAHRHLNILVTPKSIITWPMMWIPNPKPRWFLECLTNHHVEKCMASYSTLGNPYNGYYKSLKVDLMTIVPGFLHFSENSCAVESPR